MFAGPVVGVVEDAGVFVSFDLIAVKNPFEGTSAVDDVVVSLGGDVLEGDAAVVEDCAFVFFGGEADFVDDEGFFRDIFNCRGGAIEEDGGAGLPLDDFVCGEGVRDGRLAGGRFGIFSGEVVVVEVEFGEGLACFAEGHEVVEAFDDGDAREFFFEVGGEGFAVFLGVEEAVDVIEDVFPGDGARATEALPDGFEHPVGDAIVADIARVAAECRDLISFGFFVPVQRETLGCCV